MILLLLIKKYGDTTKNVITMQHIVCVQRLDLRITTNLKCVFHLL